MASTSPNPTSFSATSLPTSPTTIPPPTPPTTGRVPVIREVVIGLWELYGVFAGYRGFYDQDPVKLDPKLVHNLHKKGGTVLETSRGRFDLEKIVDGIQRHGFNHVPLSTDFDCFH
ncbi:ATP-dependent 6-phosphofructokinase 2 [Linum grandiflorum]